MSSQALRQSRCFLNLRAPFLILVSCFIFAASAPAQSPTATPSPAATSTAMREDRELRDARRRNEEAQAEYYRTHTEKLNQPAPSKSFWRTFSDNAAILGALTAALVALFTLVVNQRTALRARKDTEFYEALKRFGDKDSPTVRASAAAMLERMSDAAFYSSLRRRRRKKSREWLSKRVITHPYFDTALDQLVTGLSIEEHPTVVDAITDALTRMIPNNSDRAAKRLLVANQRLQTQLAAQLAWLSALFGQDSDDFWKVACSYTGYPREVLEDIPNIHDADFGSAHQEASLTVGTTNPLLRPAIEQTVRQQLKAIGTRLRPNVALLVTALRDAGARRTDLRGQTDLRGVFLPNANFFFADLSDSDMHAAVLFKADLRHVNFKSANLSGAHLEGAVLADAELEETNMFGVRIDSETRLDDCKWWKANFRASLFDWDVMPPDTVDRKLIDAILTKAHKPNDEQLREAHESVLDYIRNAGARGMS